MKAATETLEITPATKVQELLDRYPFLLDFLAAYRPELAKLKNPLLRNTLGRVATLETTAQMAGVHVNDLVADLQTEVKARAKLGGEFAGAGGGPAGDGARREALREIVLDLHAGKDFDEAKRRFAELVRDVDHAEIAALEQQLIREGLPEAEIKRLCDVHVALFKDSLEREQARQKEAAVPPGHPVHTFRAENEALTRVIERFRGLLERSEDAAGPDREAAFGGLRPVLDQLCEVEKHYLRKENQLFPALEAKGFEGPTKVMWAIHDDVRDALKAFRSALERSDPGTLRETGEKLLTLVSDMIYKEERILFPAALDLLEEQDWVRIRQGEDDVGYALGVKPGDEWRFSQTPQSGAEIMQGRSEAAPEPGNLPRIPLDTGLLTADQVNLLLRHLPVDVSFVDEQDEVRYYSEGERVFPRSPGVIGRKVQNCHPPQSVAAVQKILDEFRAGTKDVAEFWLTLNGRFVHIRYFAVRDRAGTYRGTLEVVQDVTGVRKLEGERRLLDW